MASVARPAAPAASPTQEASSAPRTETTTAAPASAPSSHPEVRCVSQTLLRLNLSHYISCRVKHFYTQPRKRLAAHFIFPLHRYKVTADFRLYIFGCCISWAWIQMILTLTLNSLSLFPCRMVVWSLRSIQPEWDILPRFIQCGSLQWY